MTTDYSSKLSKSIAPTTPEREEVRWYYLGLLLVSCYYHCITVVTVLLEEVQLAPSKNLQAIMGRALCGLAENISGASERPSTTGRWCVRADHQHEDTSCS